MNVRTIDERKLAGSPLQRAQKYVRHVGWLLRPLGTVSPEGLVSLKPTFHRGGVVASCIVLLSFFLGAADSSACVFNPCRYEKAAISPISYRSFSVASKYETAVKDAATKWNAQSVPGYFAEHSTSWDPEINVTDGVYPGTWIAVVSYNCSGAYYSGGEVNFKWDTNTASSYTKGQLKKIGVHELGHAYGLDHEYGAVAMNADPSVFLNIGGLPKTDDINGVSAAYK